MSITAFLNRTRREKEAHKNLVAAAKAFIEQPCVQRLESLQKAVWLSEENINAGDTEKR
ncbi:hypothetical protein C7446_2532 [Kushneria sinocarnis]|uniref:Uncharacterized protein n=1 Tax=Kushneria sinocarnis TaxID=595502 RepID=A0A420WUK1_9GAMM|nr:hypothetical protein [Kushneria sinocarnis]RKQ97113.1 hypothetical protein C7446_2532 [Kushneria sinocarnis]